MAEDIRQNWGSVATVTATGLQALANAAAATTDTVDLGNPGPFALALEAKLMCTGSTATGNVDVYAKYSHDNSDFSDSSNDLLVGTVRIAGATQGLKIMAIPVHAQYLKLRFSNNIAGPLATGGHSLTFKPVSVDQA